MFSEDQLPDGVFKPVPMVAATGVQGMLDGFPRIVRNKVAVNIPSGTFDDGQHAKKCACTVCPTRRLSKQMDSEILHRKQSGHK